MILSGRIKRRLLLVMAIMVVIALAVFVAIRFWGGSNKEPIKIGFSTTLTGKPSSWGGEARNGAMLAVEQINNAGGINGRPIELLMRNDGGKADQALRQDAELIDLGVVAILGHYQSAITAKVAPLVNERKTLLVSTSAVTPSLSDLDDYVVRLNLPIDKCTPFLVKYAYEKLGIRSLAIIYETQNYKYTFGTYKLFRKTFEDLGGTVPVVVELDSSKDYSASDIARTIQAHKPDALYLITNSLNGAILSQHMRRLNKDIKILAGGWAFNDPVFIKNGGRAVEGVIALSTFSGDLSQPSLREFAEAYRKRYDDEVSEASCNGYDGVRLLAQAIKQAKPGQSLKQAVLEVKNFRGADSLLSFDKYGDVIRPIHVRQIKDGKIVVVGTFMPAEQPNN